MGQVLPDPSLFLALSFSSILSRFDVVETKNMKGWIFGSANQKQWTQKIFKHTAKFQNPLQVKQERLQQVTDTQRCTKCGADMVKRTATKGKNAGNEFLGCSAFPKCRSVLRL